MPQRGVPGDHFDAIERNVGRRIRHLRLQRGLSQSDLAELVSVSYQQIQKYEKGQTNISLQRLVLIAQSLNVGIQDLLNDPSESLREPRDRYLDGGGLLVNVTQEELNLVKLFRKIQNENLRKSVFLQLAAAVEMELAVKKPK